MHRMTPTEQATATFALMNHSGRTRLLILAALATAVGGHGATALAAGARGLDDSTVVEKSAAAPARPTAASSTLTPDVAQVAQWIASTHDNGTLPYLLIDKINAEVFAFDALGHLQSAAPALLGLARGDRSIDGIGDKKMAAITPQERITPAGRFIVSLSHDSHGKEILWLDYKNAIALHAVVKGTPQERRAERLASRTPADNRISYGCINVPLAFYNTYVSAAFRHTNGLVYILPETTSAGAFFGYGAANTGTKSTTPIGPKLARLAPIN